MLTFKLDPEISYPGLHCDVRCIVDIDPPITGEMKIVNRTTGNELSILLATAGRIMHNGKTVAIDACRSIETYFNLFGHNKTNDELAEYTSLDIECVVSDKQGQSQSAIAVFRNARPEGEPELLPVEVADVDSVVNLSSQQSLNLKITATGGGRHEFFLADNKDSENRCDIEVFTQPGVPVEITVPWRVLQYDLGLCPESEMNVKLFYIRIDGEEHKMRHRRPVPIPMTDIRLIGGLELPPKQNRRNPAGEDLSDEFVISDRYWVHTWEDFSNYKSRPSDTASLENFSTMLFEGQELHAAASKARNDYVADQQNQTGDGQGEAPDWRKIEGMPVDTMKKHGLPDFAKIYLDKSVQVLSSDGYHRMIEERRKQQVQISERSHGDCGCSRKEKEQKR